MPIISPTSEEEIGGSQLEADLGKGMRLYLKNKLKAKGLRGVAQVVVGCLASGRP
jgi:hypothetical protein